MHRGQGQGSNRRHSLSGGNRLPLSVLRQTDNLRWIRSIQRVSHQAALLGAHTAGVGVYHVRQKDKSDGSHAAPQVTGDVPRGQTGTT